MAFHSFDANALRSRRSQGDSQRLMTAAASWPAESKLRAVVAGQAFEAVWAASAILHLAA